jgi:hypothetical protein
MVEGGIGRSSRTDHTPYPAKSAMRAATSSALQLAYVTLPINNPERGSSRTADTWAEYI